MVLLVLVYDCIMWALLLTPIPELVLILVPKLILILELMVLLMEVEGEAAELYAQLLTRIPALCTSTDMYTYTPARS